MLSRPTELARPHFPASFARTPTSSPAVHDQTACWELKSFSSISGFLRGFREISWSLAQCGATFSLEEERNRYEISVQVKADLRLVGCQWNFWEADVASSRPHPLPPWNVCIEVALGQARETGNMARQNQTMTLYVGCRRAQVCRRLR